MLTLIEEVRDLLPDPALSSPRGCLLRGKNDDEALPHRRIAQSESNGHLPWWKCGTPYRTLHRRLQGPKRAVHWTMGNKRSLNAYY